MVKYYVSYMQLDNSGVNMLKNFERFNNKKEVKKFLESIIRECPDWAKPQEINIIQRSD